MRLNDKAVGLGLGACLILAGCGGGGNDRPRLAYPVYGNAPSGGFPPSAQPAPPPEVARPVDRAPPPISPPYAQPGQPAPLGADERDAGPPPSSGPSATSGRGAERYDEVGYATWYGNEMAGGRTASGSVFDPKGFTAAHRTLPFGTRVRVDNLANGRSVVVRINDRGPFIRGRVIDVTHAAALQLGMVGTGVASVRLTVLSARGDLPVKSVCH